MTESRPIPEIAKTAHALARRDWQRTVIMLSVQTVAALGLREDDNWSVNFDTGIMTREIPDPPEAP